LQLGEQQPNAHRRSTSAAFVGRMIPANVAGSEQKPHSSDQPNVVPDQIHLALNLDELATIVMALRASGLHGFADRLDAVLRQAAP
jgi:hypothetical protein